MSLKKQMAFLTTKIQENRGEYASQSTKLHDEWAKLRTKYDMGSQELNHFYQLAFRCGSLCDQEIALSQELRDLERRQTKTLWGRIKRLFHI